VAIITIQMQIAAAHFKPSLYFPVENRITGVYTINPKKNNAAY